MKTRAPAQRSEKGLSQFRNERGSVLALVTLLLIVFLGLAALAIDLGLLFVARGEAQRAADAAAHAGAGHFISAPQDEEGARDQAIAFGERNLVRGQPASIDRYEDIDVDLDDQLVRVRAHRITERGNPVSTLFAGVLGFRTTDVAASAAAQVMTAAMAECVLPMALPDRWCEEGDGSNCDRLANQSDNWDPDDDGDFYIPWVQNPEADPEDWVYNQNRTGYSNLDRGLEMTLRPEPSGQGNQSDTRWNPSWWNAFRFPEEDSGGQGGGTDRFRDRVLGCRDNDPLVGVGSDVAVEPGNFGNPAKGAFDDLIAQDAQAVWNPSANNGQGCVTSSGSMLCRGSARVRPMVLFNPYEGPDKAGTQPFSLSNLVAVFVESTQGSGANVQINVRFVEYTGAVPAAGGAGSGSLIQALRIVE